MVLPLYQNSLAKVEPKDFQQMQTNWATQINPVINKVQNQSSILTKVTLVNGSNTIKHNLGKALTGWKIVRQRALASIYDNQDNNTTPTVNLILISNAAVVVDIEVF